MPIQLLTCVWWAGGWVIVAAFKVVIIDQRRFSRSGISTSPLIQSVTSWTLNIYWTVHTALVRTVLNTITWSYTFSYQRLCNTLRTTHSHITGSVKHSKLHIHISQALSNIQYYTFTYHRLCQTFKTTHSHITGSVKHSKRHIHQGY